MHLYQELSQNADALFYICMTAAFTGGYEAALQAKEMAKKLPKTTIEVLDSKSVECSQLFITLEAAKAAAQGKNLDEVIQLVNDMITRVTQFSFRDTLFYLDKGGRICEAKSWAEAEGKIYFRAIVEPEGRSEGITKSVAIAKTRKQIMERMIETAKERVGDSKLRVLASHTRAPEEAKEFKEMVESHFNCGKTYVYEGSATVDVFNGRNLLDLGFYVTIDCEKGDKGG